MSIKKMDLRFPAILNQFLSMYSYLFFILKMTRFHKKLTVCSISHCGPGSRTDLNVLFMSNIKNANIKSSPTQIPEQKDPYLADCACNLFSKVSASQA